MNTNKYILSRLSTQPAVFCTLTDIVRETEESEGTVKNNLTFLKNANIIKIERVYKISLTTPQPLSTAIMQDTTPLQEKETIQEVVPQNPTTPVLPVLPVVSPQPSVMQEQEVVPQTQKQTPKTKNFVVPTIKEITDYCIEKNINVNSEKFYHFYESKGWMIGKNKMKLWHSALRTWERKDNNNLIKKKVTLPLTLPPEKYINPTDYYNYNEYRDACFRAGSTRVLEPYLKNVKWKKLPITEPETEDLPF